MSKRVFTLRLRYSFAALTYIIFLRGDVGEQNAYGWHLALGIDRYSTQTGGLWHGSPVASNVMHCINM